MSYTEKLSEQLATKDVVVAIATGTSASTGSIIDMQGYHRLVAIAKARAVSSTTSTTSTAKQATTTATASTSCKVAIKISASTSSAFGGTATVLTTGALGGTGSASTWTSTFTGKSVVTATNGGTGKTTASATTTASGELALDVSGELVQSRRAAEDRYVRATITLTGVTDNSAGIVQADTARNKPV